MDRDTRGLLTIGLIGIIAGFIGSFVAGGGGGLIGYLVSGVIGSFVGRYVLNALGVDLGIRNEFVRQVVTATVGAVIVIVVARLIT